MSLNRLENYRLDHRGALNSIDYRIFYRDSNNQPISPWHDIPLIVDRDLKTFRLVAIGSRWSTKWLTVAVDESLNPIRYESEGNRIKFIPNLFPFHGCQANYCIMPQTLLPKFATTKRIIQGCLEIGERVLNTGEVVLVKILGCFSLVVNSQIIWMILVIDVTDPIADLLNDIDDIQNYKPQLIRTLQEWFWRFKAFYVCQESEQIDIDFEIEPKNRHLALMKVIEAHKTWFNLMKNSQPILGHFQLTNTTLNNSHTLTPMSSNAIVCQRPESELLSPLPVDETAVSKWYFGYLKKV